MPENISLARDLELEQEAIGVVGEDIRCLLGIAAEGEFVASFNRPNLFLAVEPRHDALAQVLTFLEPRRGQARLAPVYQALSGTVSYEELHLLRLYLLLT